jgi:hypothetical protein
MLRVNSDSVVAYERIGAVSSVVVTCNFSAEQVTVSLAGELKAKSIKTLAQSGEAMEIPVSLNLVRLPAFGVWVAEIEYPSGFRISYKQNRRGAWVRSRS